ncbi:arylsulfatase [Labilibacter sediminis]|nr:arylsulfatase [Labilibacter sediminis]
MNNFKIYLLIGLLSISTVVVQAKIKKAPNLVIIFTDDQGYADLGCYGAKGFETPNIDKLADTGMRFTDFYVGASVCTPSRAALLTGCYPNRVGLGQVLFPKGPKWTHNKANRGFNTDETTLAEMLKGEGYATACVGKWHLGHLPEFLPPSHGFDEYFGLPYSNDMLPGKPLNFPALPLIEGLETIEENPDQDQLTTRFTERAVDFINRKSDDSFFLYLAHPMPHVPLHVSDKFRGKSKHGLYGDVIMEIDWSVGEVIKALKENGVYDNTLVIFSSDNGPWLIYGEHAGSAGPLREGKSTSFDGGQRVPCIMSWPAKIPAGKECDELVTAMDILPTMAMLTGTELPANKIDGKDISRIIKGKRKATSPHEIFLYITRTKLEAARMGDWKLGFPKSYGTITEPGKNGKKGKAKSVRLQWELYNLKDDIGETNNLAKQYPELVEKIKKRAEEEMAQLEAEKRPCGIADAK